MRRIALRRVGRVPLALLAVVLTTLACGTLPTPASAAPRRVPAGFFGVNVDGPVFDDPRVVPAVELARMRGAGVRRIRAVLDWAYAQPDGPGSVDWTRSDALVGDAAAAGLRVLPVVIRTPGWALSLGLGGYGAPPRDPQDYARFLTLLVARYGPAGSFWAEHPGLPRRPIRDWQIWNEPNIGPFWLGVPYAPTYAALLRPAAAAIHAADPGARVVLAGLSAAGLVGDQVIPAPVALQALYDQGAKGSFDVIAIHPYVATPALLTALLRRVRLVAAANGQPRLPLVITELSWSSDNGQAGVDFDTSEVGQGQALTAAFTEIARRRVGLRIAGAFWYTWLSPSAFPDAGWDKFAGLNRMQGDVVVPKPAFTALQSAIATLSARRRTP